MERLGNGAPGGGVKRGLAGREDLWVIRAVEEFPVDAPGGRLFVRPSLVGELAQLVEQRTENPCVPGSIPGLATIFR